MNGATLLWFRLDLRLSDNPALQAAIDRGEPVIPVLIWSPEEEGPWKPGGASRWWLHQSIGQLQSSLRALGSRLIIRRGPTLQTLPKLVEEIGATAVYWNRRYEPALIERDRSVKAALRQSGQSAESFNSTLLLEPWELSTQTGQPYQVFTPFWKASRAKLDGVSALSTPTKIPVPKHWPTSMSLRDLELEPSINWFSGLQSNWTPGELGAQNELKRFIESGVTQYSQGRDRPDKIGTSRLSPHLHFGEIGPRQVWAAVHACESSGSESAQCYQRELGWREFAYHLLFHFPHTPEQSLRENFARFPWKKNADHLRAWQRGQTGYPIVDAGMRELRHTGWMHNRVRMIAASFLVKDLLISWRDGAAWFWDNLVDADLASNTLGWQWSAGCGADAAPYFRIFNPMMQGEKFDPEGEYVRRWIPELAKLSTDWIHKPWETPARFLAQADIALGKNYPLPIVDHREARTRALAAFQFLKHD